MEVQNGRPRATLGQLVDLKNKIIESEKKI